MKTDKENNRIGKLFQKIKLSKENQEKALILFLLGVFFLLAATPVSTVSKKKQQKKEVVPEVIDNAAQKNTNNAYISELENKLEQIIGNMEGAGRVKVMLTLKDNGEKILDKNQPYESTNQTSKEEGKESESTVIKSEPDTVLLEEDGNTVPIVIQERYPEIEGVFVLCEGGGNKELTVHIKEALQALFSIDSHKIVVYKLKIGNR